MPSLNMLIYEIITKQKGRFVVIVSEHYNLGYFVCLSRINITNKYVNPTA